jgi:aminomethyltransferase
MELRQTPLHAWHVARQAKMVDFGGWSMPLHYGSQIEEHVAVREGVGLFDVSHMQVLDLEGASARPFLRYLVANDVDKLKIAGKALYSCMLNPEGGVIDDLIIYYFSENFFRIVVNAGTAAKDIAWIESCLATFPDAPQLKVRDDVGLIAVQGARAREVVWEAFSGLQTVTEHLKPFNAVIVGEGMVARTGYTGEDGFEMMLPSNKLVDAAEQLAIAGARPCGLGARDTLRLEAGMNLYGQDMDETTRPDVSGLTWTIDRSTERDFIGRAVLDSSAPTQQLVGLLLLDKGVIRSHCPVHTPQGVGEVTSGTFSPSLKRSIALARVPVGVAMGDLVEVMIRQQAYAAKVVKYPFVRNGKAQIDIAQ